MKKESIWKKEMSHCDPPDTSRIVNTADENILYNRDMKYENKIEKGNIIGQNIRRLRLKNGETQKQLADALGYGPTTIANYESGYRQPDIQTVSEIALRYGVSIDALLFSELL